MLCLKGWRLTGWTLSSTSHSPLGPSAVWTKTVSGNVGAPVLLGGSALVAPAGAALLLDFVASAPPAGTRASGC